MPIRGYSFQFPLLRSLLLMLAVGVMVACAGQPARAADDADAASDDAVHRMFQKRIHELMPVHRGPLDLSELYNVRNRERYLRLYLEWEERLIRELWIFAETLDWVEQWVAGEWMRMRDEEDFNPQHVDEISRVVDELAARADRFVSIAKPFLGDQNEYLLQQYESIESRMGDIHYGVAIMDRAGKRDHIARTRLRRAHDAGLALPVGVRPFSDEAVSAHFARWTSEGITAHLEKRVEELAQELPQRMARERRTERVRGLGWRYVAADPRLTAIIAEHEMQDDPRMLVFVRSFLERFYGTNPHAADYFIDEQFDYNVLHIERHQQIWEGWRFNSVGPLLVVRYLSPETMEVFIEGMTLRNERGHLWHKPIYVMVKRQPDGRYTLLFPGSDNEAWEHHHKFLEIVERRMRTFFHDHQRQQIIQQRQHELGASNSQEDQ